MQRDRQRRSRQISIHALREEGDQGDSEPEPGMDISIHALREEGDGCGCGAQV